MNPNEQRPKYYLLDLGTLLRGQALAAKKESDENPGDEYDLGRLQGYNEVVARMIDQAKAFGMELSELNLEGIDPDQDLL